MSRDVQHRPGPGVQYRVVEAKVVATDTQSLTAWLNEQSIHGWYVLAVDQGVIYLMRAAGAPL